MNHNTKSLFITSVSLALVVQCLSVKGPQQQYTGEELTMSNGHVETATDKKLFDRWKENFKEFFIEDDKKEERKSLLETNGEDCQTNNDSEEKCTSQNMLHANVKEDLEGIPEEEEEIIREETIKHAQNVDENCVDVNQIGEDIKDDNETVDDVDTNTDSLLIQQNNESQQSKTPFFKILANLSFLKKKSPEDPTAAQEQAPPDDSTNTIDKNGLPSYNEAINQQAKKPDNIADTESKETTIEVEHDSNESLEEQEECETKVETPSEKDSKPDIIETTSLAWEKDELVPNDKEEVTEEQNTPQEFDETKKEEKKFRFRFQFFTEK